MCPRGARGAWIAVGKRKQAVYVRTRTKDGWGPHYNWEKTDLSPVELLGDASDNEDEDLVF
jgi:hypothetical protein